MVMTIFWIQTIHLMSFPRQLNNSLFHQSIENILLLYLQWMTVCTIMRQLNRLILESFVWRISFGVFNKIDCFGQNSRRLIVSREHRYCIECYQLAFIECVNTIKHFHSQNICVGFFFNPFRYNLMRDF